MTSLGLDAERLVYVFCVTDRRCFYEHLGEPRFHLRDIVHGGDLELDRDSLAALIEIEVANIVDQIPYRSKKKALRSAVRYYGEQRSPAAAGLYLQFCRRSRAGVFCRAQRFQQSRHEFDQVARARPVVELRGDDRVPGCFAGTGGAR